jgi:hypothetical protein
MRYMHNAPWTTPETAVWRGSKMRSPALRAFVVSLMPPRMAVTAVCAVTFAVREFLNIFPGGPRWFSGVAGELSW